MVKKDASFYEDRFTGTLARAVNNLGSLFIKVNDQIIWSILPFVFSFALGLAALWSVSKVFVIIIAVGHWSLFYVVVKPVCIPLYESKYSEPREEDEQILSGAVTDTFSNVQTVTLFGNSKRELGSYDGSAKNYSIAVLQRLMVMQKFGYRRALSVRFCMRLSPFLCILDGGMAC